VEIEGFDHLEETIAADVVDILLLGLAAQIDASIVAHILNVSTIVLDLQSGCVANDLQIARIVNDAHTITIANNA